MIQRPKTDQVSVMNPFKIKIVKFSSTAAEQFFTQNERVYQLNIVFQEKISKISNVGRRRAAIQPL